MNNRLSRIDLGLFVATLVMVGLSIVSQPRTTYIREIFAVDYNPELF